MPIINISVKNKIATLDSCASIVCKNSDYMAHFTFDEDWNGYNVKLAKFIYNDKVIPRVFIGNDCAIPKLPNTYSCLIEVEAGDVKTSAPVHINCIPVGDNDDLEETEEYKTSVLNQILELIKNGTITRATIVKTEFVGKDANGGNVYKQIFDNGMESFFTAPKGDTVGIELGETQGTAYEGNKGAKNSQDIIHILNEILHIQANVTKNNSSISKLLLDVKNLTDRLNFIANSDDKTLDQLQEIVDFAKNNKNLIDTLNKIVDLDNITENHFVMVDGDKKLVDSTISKEDIENKVNKNGDTLNGVFKLNEKVSLLATDEIAGFAKISDIGASLIGLDANGNPVFIRNRDGDGLFNLHSASVQFSPDVPIQLPFMFLGYSKGLFDSQESLTNGLNEARGLLFGGKLLSGGRGLRFVEEFIPFDMRSRLIFPKEDDDGQPIIIPPEKVIVSGEGVVVGDEITSAEVSDGVWYEPKHRTVYSKGKIIQWHRYEGDDEDRTYELVVPDKNGTIALVEDIESAIGDISSALDELHAYAQNLVSGVV